MDAEDIFKLAILYPSTQEINSHAIFVYSQIVPDRPGFHTSNSIFPVGYCSTRVYASVQDLDRQCLYTCKISDGGTGPMVQYQQTQ